MSDPATMANRLTRGRFVIPPHVAMLSKAIVETVRAGGRLLVQMPPRHGKSETVSVWTPIWLLNAYPSRKVILASYEADFAASWGRRARNLVEEHAGLVLIRLAGDSTAAYRWETPQGGGMVTSGAGGALTGRGADLLIVDDPHKNAEEAHSQSHRDRVWDWWTSTALTRLEPGAAAIVIQTRWHEDDLAGRILAQEPDRWRVLRLPALAEDRDPLGRAPGTALWPERYDEASLATTRVAVGEQVWNALYQQAPVSEQGLMFRREWLQHRYRPVSDDAYLLPDGRTLRRENLLRYATVDLAASTKTSADYSVILTVGRTHDGRLLVLHVDRARREGPDLVPAMRRAKERHGLAALWVERTGFQLALIQQARREGLPIRELDADRDKVARALPATAALEGGRVLLPTAAPWLYEFETELLSFPQGAHDDQVDALAYAVRAQQQCGGIGQAPIVVGPRREAYDSEVSRGWRARYPFYDCMPNPPPGFERFDPRPWMR